MRLSDMIALSSSCVRSFSILLLILATGCAGVRHDRTAGFEPELPRLRYELTVSGAEPVEVHVSLSWRGDADGETALETVGAWGGVERGERFVEGLEVRTASGLRCGVLQDSERPERWTVTHPPEAELTASYRLRTSAVDPLESMATRFEPVVRDDFLLLTAGIGLLYPPALFAEPEVALELHWEGLEERGWVAVTPFEAAESSVRVSLPRFLHSVLLAGPLRVHVRRFPDRSRLTIAFAGEAWPFPDVELVDLVEDVVAIEREFTSDRRTQLLVTVVPGGPAATRESLSIAGTALADCLALTLAPGTLLGLDDEHTQQVTKLVAHEAFHLWNAGTISLRQPEILGYWFSEGFTEAFAGRLLLRAGKIDAARWLRTTNLALERLQQSPAIHATEQELLAGFWRRPELSELPILRGQALALWLDEEIRLRSGGRHDLDDFFLDVLDQAREGATFDTGDLLAGVERWCGPDPAEALRTGLRSGVLPELPVTLTTPPARRVTVRRGVYDPGLDVLASMDAKRAIGVVEGGRAHRAGLREGDLFAAYQIDLGDSEAPFEFQVLDGNGTRQVRFVPSGPGEELVQYELLADSDQ